MSLLLFQITNISHFLDHLVGDGLPNSFWDLTFEHMCLFVYFDWQDLSDQHCCTIHPPINCVKA